ncbi:hypothetical protein BDV32DRAFT_97774 [Aspergillus pseudonomiae]|nr:hypothetical protein BDV32DRAFT_97774 [Aspergillus pseudonomiae]
MGGQATLFFSFSSFVFILLFVPFSSLPFSPIMEGNTHELCGPYLPTPFFLLGFFLYSFLFRSLSLCRYTSRCNRGCKCEL